MEREPGSGGDGLAPAGAAGPGEPAGRAGRRGLAAVAAAAVVLWLVVAVPLALGRRTFFHRDVLANNFPVKAFGAAALARGEVPAFDPARGLGLPYRGNPASLAFYPDNLLYLALPFWSAFNLHFALHWLLALVAFWALAREWGLGRPAALLAALTYAGSGWVVSGLSFYNLVAVAAWWPLAMAGALSGGRRGIALGGLACGLALLAGEPVTAALAMVPLAVAAVARAGLARGLGRAAAVGALGLAVALPQVVATLRVAVFSYRGAVGVAGAAGGGGERVAYALHPLRLLELLLPLPFGRPLDFGPAGFWAAGIAPRSPFFLSLYFGIVALLLAAAALRRRPLWPAVAAAGLVAAWAAGSAGEALAAVSGGLFRFPEKLLVWTALAAPLAAGHGLELALARPRPRAVAAVTGGGLALVLAALVGVTRPAFVARAAAAGPLAGGAVDRAELVDVQLGFWAAALAVAAVVLLVAAWALSRRAAVAVVALQLLALCQLWPLVRTTPTAPLSGTPPWTARVEALAGPPGSGAAVVNTALLQPPWHPDPHYRFGAASKAAFAAIKTQDLGPAPGALAGLTYPLQLDPEGLGSPFHTLLLADLARAGWPERLRWMRLLGVDAAVVFADLGETAGVTLLDRAERAGVATYLYAVAGGEPLAWWPERVEPAASPVEALRRVSGLDDPRTTAVVARPVEQRPGGRVRVVSAGPDRIELAVSGPGGAVAVRRAYHPLWTARTADGAGLPVFPLDLTLIGIEVPPGEQTVRLAVSAWPEAVAGLLALVAAACLAAARGRMPGAGRRRGGRRDAEASAEAPGAAGARGEGR